MVDPTLGNSSNPELNAVPPAGQDSPPDEIQLAARRIAEALNEPLLWLVENAVKELGVARSQEFLEQTLAIEAQGGRLRAKGNERRTPGGVFFLLIKEQSAREQIKRIFKGPKKAPPAPSHAGAQQAGDPVPLGPMSWDEARVEIARILKLPLERASVKITLVGRPTQVSKTKSCVVVALKGSRPPSLPKGLPPAPDGSDFSYAVFISLRHWAKVAPIMAHDKDERLMVEGYPIFDPKRGVTVVLAQSVRTVNFARRERHAS